MLRARLGTRLDRIVLRFLPALARIPVHPDVLTVIGVGFAGLAGVACARGEWFLAGWLMIVAGLCDLVDGVVARAQGTGSRVGAFFDSTMDRLSDLLIFGGIATAFATRGQVGVVILSLWALGGAVLTSYARARAEAEIASLEVGLMERGERLAILALGALSGFMIPALWLVAIGATITAVQRVVVARREIARKEQTGETERPAPTPFGEIS